MSDKPSSAPDLRQRLSLGGEPVFAELFDAQRDRLRRMVQYRLDPRIRPRVGVSDVLQDVYLEASNRLGEFVSGDGLSFSLWLRLLTGKQLIALHRRHVGAKKRDVSQEVPLEPPGAPAVSSACLAGELVARMTTPSQAAIRRELQARLQAAIEKMDPIDREVLTLRHFEELGNHEVAALLGITREAASKRHIRALRRLRELLADLPVDGI